MKITITLFFILFIFSYASAQNYGITINQTSSNYDCLVGSTDCHDILSALNGYAQIKNSSTSLNIYLTEGTYSGVNNTNLIISNSTIIISPVINETGQVTIDLQSNGRFISIGDNQFSYLTLISLTIINGKASQGGVLEVISSAVVFLNNITAYNNNADYGGFLYAAPKVSGRFYIDNNSTMTNNSANVDGSIYYSSSASVLNLYDSTFSENWNSTLIYAVNTAINIANVLIDNNTGSDTLIQITNGNQTIVHFLTMSNNKLSKTTGTSFWRYFYGTGSFYSSNFTNNTGGSVFRYMNSESTTGTLLFYKCSFDSNSGADYGSAIYVDSDSQISLMYITFTSNTANIDAGAVYFDGEANDTSYTQYLSSFSYTTFTNNSATNVNSKANDIYAFATSFNLETVTLYSINTNITANTSAPIYCNSSTVSIGVITTNILDGHIMNCNSGTCTIYGIESQCVSDHSGSSSSEPRYIKPKLSNGQIIGICFGAAGAIAIVVVLFLVYRHQRNKYQSIN